jgi:hypothetical protein
MTHARLNGRVLTIEPTDRGFGYAIFEGPELIDFGERRIRGENPTYTHRACTHETTRQLRKASPPAAAGSDSSTAKLVDRMWWLIVCGG